MFDLFDFGNFFQISHDIVKQNFILTLSNGDFVMPLSNRKKGSKSASKSAGRLPCL